MRNLRGYQGRGALLIIIHHTGGQSPTPTFLAPLIETEVLQHCPRALDQNLIRRHPEVFFVSFEHLPQEFFKSLFQSDGGATFIRPFFRVDGQFGGGNRIRNHKQASSFLSGESRNSSSTCEL